MASITKLWFVTDLRGSSRCFRKLTRAPETRKDPDVLILGGNWTGRLLLPIIRQPDETWTTRFRNETIHFTGRDEIEDFERKAADLGAYPVKCDVYEYNRMLTDLEYKSNILLELQRERMVEWLDMASDRLGGKGRQILVQPGPSDPNFVTELLRETDVFVYLENAVHQIDDNGLNILCVSYGEERASLDCHQPNDRNSFLPRDRLYLEIEALANEIGDFRKCIFHCSAPPAQTQLDEIKWGGDGYLGEWTHLPAEHIHVGSYAVHDAIDRYQPPLSLHGYVTEVYCYQRIGGTVAYNPGSESTEGLLRGVYIKARDGSVYAHALTREGAGPGHLATIPLSLIGPIRWLIGSKEREDFQKAISKMESEHEQRVSKLSARLAERSREQSELYLQLGMLQKARDCVREYQDLITELRDSRHSISVLLVHGLVEHFLGEFDRAEEDFLECRLILQRTEPLFIGLIANWFYRYAELLLDQGRVGEVEDAWNTLRHREGLAEHPVTALTKGRLALVKGEMDAARKYFRRGRTAQSIIHKTRSEMGLIQLLLQEKEYTEAEQGCLAILENLRSSQFGYDVLQIDCLLILTSVQMGSSKDKALETLKIVGAKLHKTEYRRRQSEFTELKEKLRSDLPEGGWNAQVR